MNKKCIIILQARVDSSRFPRKVLAKIEGKPMLFRIIERLKQIKNCEIVVATTTRKIDDTIIKIATSVGVEYFRGKTNDVLDRFFQTALKFKADAIMRITADCPLIDPKESKKVLYKFLKGNFDYVSNGNETYPDGLDTECFSFYALKEAWKKAKLKSEREHVTPYIRKNQKFFKIGTVRTEQNMEKYRWTVDYKDDLIFVRKIYARLYKKNRMFLMRDILELLRKEPSLMKINAIHTRNEGYAISLEND